MPLATVAEKLQETDDVVELLRAQGNLYEENFPVVPNEQTHWLDEQRAVMEDCALADLSHHMTSVHVEGPDAVDFLTYLCVNNFRDLDIGRAKQSVICSPDGYLWGDGPILRFGENEFWGVPIFTGDWINYNVETGDWDVSVEVEFPTSYLDGDPEKFIYQVQGPNAMDVLERVTDADLREISFYGFEEITLAGHEVIAFGHGMNTEAGFEFIGPFEHAEDVRNAFLDAGKEHGIRQLGSRAYLSQSVRLGWIPAAPPPIYESDELEGYREWLDVDSRGSTYSISGSFDSADITDYYMSPIELGYGKLIDFDHEFLGREAIEAEAESPDRSEVSLRWNTDDVLDTFASLFREGVMDGENAKLMDNLPRVGWAWGVFDEVRADGELVGLSHSRAYEPDVPGMVSLAVLDTEYSDPGTEVRVVWGEPDGHSPNPKVEEHTQTEIRATVGTVQYTDDRRKTVAK